MLCRATASCSNESNNGSPRTGGRGAGASLVVVELIGDGQAGGELTISERYHLPTTKRPQSESFARPAVLLIPAPQSLISIPNFRYILSRPRLFSDSKVSQWPVHPRLNRRCPISQNPPPRRRR